MDNTYEKDVFISEELRYFNLTNIFFETPIDDTLLEGLKEIFFSINNITQIYFDKDIDIQGIEKIKYLLEISPTMEDEKIEKYIINSDKVDIDTLSQINFLNPSTWMISKKEMNHSNRMISISEYKKTRDAINKIIAQIDKDEYSTIEKVTLIYDFCKRLKLEDKKTINLYEVLSSKTTNKFGYSYVFSELLKEINISNYIGNAITDSEVLDVVIAYIKDDVYGIDGIYLFDIFSDYIDSKDVPNDELKGLNYNYFAIRLSDYSKTIFSDRLTGILNSLIHDMEYDLEKLRFISMKDVKELESCFDMKFIEIHQKIEQTKEISDSDKINIFTRVNEEDKHILIKQNYVKRKNRLLNYDIELLDKVI